MTDLISSLADSIVSLINSKPESPTKAEVEDAIYAPLQAALDAYHYEAKPLFKHHGADGFHDRYRRRRADEARQSQEPDAFRDVSQKLKDAMNTSIYGGPTREDRDKYWAKKLNEPTFVKWSAPSDYTDWSPDPTAGSMPLADWKRLAKCPGSTDGKHAWYEGDLRGNTASADINAQPLYTPILKCHCGAVKPR